MKHVAILRNGGKVEITLPLKPCVSTLDAETPIAHWREDQNGVLINLDYVAAIVGAEREPMRHYRGGW